MLRLSVNEMTTLRWSFEEDVHNYQAVGFDAMSVWRHKLSDFGEDKGADLLEECGMSVASLLWAGGFTGSDGRTYKESLDDTREAIRLAALLKAESLIVYTGGRAGHTHSHARRLVKGALQELSGFMEEWDVTLALEPMHAGCAADWTFLTDLHETLELIDQIGNPRLKINFDTYHLGQDSRILAEIPQLVPRIAIVQLGDCKLPPHGEQNRCRLGEGSVPLREIVAALSSAGYNGHYDIELMGEDIETSDYRDLLRQSKQAVADLFRLSGTP